MQPIIDRAYSTETFRNFGHQLIDLLSDHLAATKKGENNTFYWSEPDHEFQNWMQDFEEAKLIIQLNSSKKY